MHALGGVGGAHRGDERLALGAGRQVVVGDAGGDERVLAGLLGLALERAGEREVQLGVLAGEQVVVHDLAQQRMAELVAAARVGHDHVRLRRLADDRPQLGRAEPARLREHRVGQHAPRGEHAQHVLRRIAQALDAHHQRVAQRGREPAAAVEPRGQQLLGEQRVALAARVQALDELVVGRAAENVLEQLRELVAGQPRQLDPARPRVALELGQQRAQRVASVQLVGAVGGDDEHPLGPQAAREEDEERARRAVGPVDVLEHERERLLAAQQVEQRQQRLEQPRLALRRLAGRARLAAELGEQRRELGAGAGGELVENRVALAREPAQDADDRRVGELLVAELDALADRDAGAAVGRPAGELGDRARLADARLARHEGERGAAVGGVAQRGLELGELRRAPDQPAARHPRGHRLSIHQARLRARLRRRGRAAGGGAGGGCARPARR